MTDTIEDFTRKIKSFFETLWQLHKEELILSAIIIMVGISSFALGVLSTREGHPPIEVRSIDASAQDGFTKAYAAATSSEAVKSDSLKNTSGPIVASKNGTAYYLPGCSGASRIMDKNKVYFQTETEAQAAGYHIAGSCKK